MSGSQVLVFLGVAAVAGVAYAALNRSQRLANPGQGKCYACDAPAVGRRNRQDDPEGKWVPACKRHREVELCIYCNAPVRKGSLEIDGDPAHKKCHLEACK